MAARYLRRQHGFKILHRNFRSSRGGEIDLVCRDRRENVLVFVEVKTRSSDRLGAPRHAVTLAQQNRIERGARAWLRRLDDRDVSYRFDVVEIVMEGTVPRLTLQRHAFSVPDDVYG